MRGRRPVNENCPCCGSDRLVAHFDTREMLFGTKVPFSYRRCAQCGSLALADPPPDMSPFYPSHYYSFSASTDRAGRMRRRIGAARAAAYGADPAPKLSKLAVKLIGRPDWRDQIFFAAPPVTARIVDVGSGAGNLLDALWNDGYTDLTGVDPFLDPAVAEERRRPGLQFVRGDLGELDPGIDLVMFNHSLEHVPDPFGQLVDAHRLLAPGGRVLVRVPVADSDNAERYGPNWYSLDPPRHLTVPTRDGLRTLARRAGFTCVQESDDSGGYGAARSELYARDVPAIGPDGSEIDLQVHFSDEELQVFERTARLANIAGRGDTARVLLERM